MDKQDLFRRAKDAIVDADEAKALRIIEEAKNAEFDLLDLLLSGFGAGNDEIGSLFDRGALSLPELIYAAEVMKSVTNTILNLLNENERPVPEKRGRILLATVAGDVHDIGKGIVASTLRTAGFEVIDLGCEVPVETIIEEARRYKADIIGTSALLTSTMTEQKKLEKLLMETGEKESFITMVGGAPCTPRWAKKIGASGYSEDAIEAVKVALQLMKEKEEQEKNS
ncbi:dimethylamine corrinoid protein 3 [Anaerotruncus sp. 80]|uniref:Dimethylamine corrinoid protein 3 n=1 Tax=Anaerotruncus colihominis TaxID=169435 RepID=A0A845QG62_9FIRM|nr:MULTISPECIES: cobalamin-dependent protein [Clostridia]NBH60306.1 dimethylamine corrinoid protein 3 [Anaerotruncus colihominis]NCF00046.1 dimethylamine corrinoid protein 3 [Emergencia sp. 1XD21-10]NCF00960.1 dimethylamine corrinoid protein 3 [Anaerotruncus sp. 80]